MLQNAWYQIGRSMVNFYVRQVMRANIHHACVLPKGAKIIAANHPSTNDPAFVTIITKEHTTILIKDSLFKIPLFGRSLRLAGHVPVIHGNGRAALEAGMRLLRAGRTVMIFPEGTISPDGGYNKAHTGMARLALATGAPVIPVGISLNQKQLRLINTKIDGGIETGAWYLRGPYALTVGEPIAFTGDAEDREQVLAVTGRVMDQIALLSHQGHLRLAAGRAPLLNIAAPRAALQSARHGTWQAFKQTLAAVGRSPVFRAAESAVLFLLMVPRHF